MDLKALNTGFNTFLDTKVARLNQNHKLAIWIAALLAPVALFYFLFYSPKSEEIGKLEKAKSALIQEIDVAKEKAKAKGEQEALLAETMKKFKAASELLPDQKEIPSLLNNISGQGTNSGLDVLSFKPMAEVRKDFYAEIPVELTVTGPYHNVGVFLDKISKLPRLVAVSELNMGTPKLSEGEMLLNTKLNLITYRFLETSDGKSK